MKKAAEDALDPRAREVLEARGRRYARPADAAGAAVAGDALLVFRAGGERYAVAARLVREVAVGTVTPLPGAPAGLTAVAAVGGEIVPVADFVSLVAGRPGSSAPAGGAAPLVVLGEDRAELAIAADEVEAVTAVAPAAAPAAAKGAAPGRAWTVGVTEDGIVLLDARAILDDPRLGGGTHGEPSEEAG